MRRFPVTQLALRVALAAACLALAGVVAPTLATADQQHRSYLRVGETANGTARQITLGLNKSMIIQLPREVREVMVSNPAQIDAVLQTSTRAYLIGKAAGEANIIFVDKDGRQVVSLEVTIERDLAGLETVLNQPHTRRDHPCPDRKRQRHTNWDRPESRSTPLAQAKSPRR